MVSLIFLSSEHSNTILGQLNMISEYWTLLRDASDLIATMKMAILRSAFSDNDACHSVTLKCNLIKCLTSKGILHWLLHDHDESRRLAVECVYEVISITEGFRDDEYPLADACVGVSGRVDTRSLY